MSWGLLPEQYGVQVFHFSESKDKEETEASDGGKENDVAQSVQQQDTGVHAQSSDKKSS